jgi:hypothetical protein
MEIFCFCEGMSSFELSVSKIRVQLSILTFASRQVYVRAENVLIESYFRNRNCLKMNGSWIYSVQNCLEEFIAEFPNVIVDGKAWKITCAGVQSCFVKLQTFTEEKPQVGR